LSPLTPDCKANVLFRRHDVKTLRGMDSRAIGRKFAGSFNNNNNNNNNNNDNDNDNDND
jgi:hypothetical protein